MHTIVRNGFTNLAAQGIILGGNLLVTPILLNHLGFATYGVWAILLALTGTAAALDLGLSVAVTRAVPDLMSKGMHGSLSCLLLVAAAAYLGMALAVLGFSTILLPALAGGAEIGEQRALLPLLASALFLSASLSGLTRAVLQGLMRFDMAALLTVGGFAFYWPAALLGTSAENPLSNLAVAMVVMFAIQTVFGAAIAMRIAPTLRTRPDFSQTNASLGYIVRFGAPLQVSYVSDVVKTNGPRLMAGALFGPEYAAFYDVGARMANAAWALPAAVLPAIIPAAALAHSEGDTASLRQIYLHATTLVLMLALPLAVLFATAADKIVLIWLGPAPREPAFVLAALALGNVLHLSTGGGTFVARGMARPEIEARYQLMTLVLYVVLALALARVFGFFGIPAGIAVASSVGGLVFAWLFGRWLSVPTLAVWSVARWPVLATVAASLCAVIARIVATSAAPLMTVAAMAGSIIAVYASLLLIAVRRGEVSIIGS